MICETRELYVCAEVRCLKVNTKQSLSASEIYDVGFDIEEERAIFCPKSYQNDRFYLHSTLYHF